MGEKVYVCVEENIISAKILTLQVERTDTEGGGDFTFISRRLLSSEEAPLVRGGG